MNANPILGVSPLAFPWETPDPFLFCAYHLDAYPQGNEQMGPAAPLTGRDIGMDFAGKDGWRMYHGDVVPGFPRHPHRGFETVTIARAGFIDHSDSLGAAARFGKGDVQWVTAGRGIVHSEMFPLLKRDAPNPAELFQIWLNLPAAGKFVAPYFTMLWSGQVPTVTARDPAGRETAVTLVAGRLGETRAPNPPPNSWAARPDSDVAIWTVRMAPEARWTLPPAQPGSNRSLYVFRGGPLRVAGQPVAGNSVARLRADAGAELHNGGEATELLLLQGKPIGEPVVQHGPFVMNSRAEIVQAFEDYQRDEFGGWPWPSDGPVHPAAAGRHARYPDGRVENAD
jgi:redox-sensitive bicupin YhaK (pirin superfamily)